MRLFIPGTGPTEVSVEPAQGHPDARDPMRRRDAVLRFYGLDDPVRAADAELPNKDHL